MKSLIPWKRRNDEGSGTALAERPRDALMQMRRDWDSLFDRFFGDWLSPFGEGSMMGRNTWGFDIEETENEVMVRAEAPGFEPDDFSVEVVGDSLVLRAEHKEEDKEGNGYRWREGRFYRSVNLPRGIDADKIDAKYRNGVLEVHVPRKEEARGKRITVKSV